MQQDDQSLFDLHVDQQSIRYLSEGARWAKFLGITGFIFCGLMAVAAFLIVPFAGLMPGSAMPAGYAGIGAGAITFFYLIFAAIWFIPCLFLFRFGSQMQMAIKANQQERLYQSLRNLKGYFKYIGILVIIMLSFYAVAIVAVIGVTTMR